MRPLLSNSEFAQMLRLNMLLVKNPEDTLSNASEIFRLVCNECLPVKENLYNQRPQRLAEISCSATSKSCFVFSSKLDKMAEKLFKLVFLK